MRRICTLLLVLVLIFCGEAFAHPGRTDSRGGHTDHATGEYHYHHGYPAHQHPDGECPYLSKSTPTATPRPKSAPTASPAPESTAFLRTRSSASAASTGAAKRMSWKQLGDALVGTAKVVLNVLIVFAQTLLTTIGILMIASIALGLGATLVLTLLELIFKIKVSENVLILIVGVPAVLIWIAFSLYATYITVGSDTISALLKIWTL